MFRWTKVFAVLAVIVSGLTPPAFAVSYPGVSNVQVTASGQASGGLKVSWTNPTFHSDFSGLEVRVKKASGELVQSQVIESDSISELPITGLINGTEYSAEVATLYGGAPNDQLAVSAGNAIPYDVPSAPAKPSISRTNAGEIKVTWLAPNNNGNAISGYKVSCNPACPNEPISTTNLEVTISGLTTSTAYTASVIATNERGDSVASISSDAIKPHANVVPPTNLVITPGDAQAVVSWTAPTISGATVSSYSVQLFLESNPGVAVATKSVASATTTFTGLTNGVKYFFKVSTVVGSITSAPATSLLGLTAATIVPAPPAPPAPVTPPAAAVPATPSAPVAAPAPQAPASPVMAPKQKTSGSALATQIGMTVTPKAKIKLTVAKESKKICKVSGGKLVALAPGNCSVTVSVTPAKTKLVKKPKATKQATVVAIS